MADVTDFVFREIISTIGKPDVLFTEFISADGLYSSGRKSLEGKLRFSEKQQPIVAQIWGATPENFVKAAQEIEERGFDGIDINMGCPDKAVMKKNSGAALIGNMPLVRQLVESIKVSAPSLPLSVKTRIGETEIETKEWISFLLSLKIDALTIHGRAAESRVKGEVDWNSIGEVVKLKNSISPATIIMGNGDVKTTKEIQKKQEVYGVDGVMVGRGIFQNPWLFENNSNANEHTKNDYLDLLEKHSQLFTDTWGDTKNFASLRKFFKVYVKEFRGSNKLRQQLMKAVTHEEVKHNIESVMKQK
jgi:nifR3 family TIM-barrel protein